MTLGINVHVKYYKEGLSTSVSARTLIQLRFRIAKNLILITEDVVVDIKFVWHRTLVRKKTTNMNT